MNFSRGIDDEFVVEESQNWVDGSGSIHGSAEHQFTRITTTATMPS